MFNPMKQKIYLVFSQILLVGIFLIGLSLIWASMQSFDALTVLLNNLSPDGELETFSFTIYQTLKIPFAILGIGVVVLSVFVFFQWGKTVVWFQALPAQSKRFLCLLRTDTRLFWRDVKTALLKLGWQDIVVLLGGMFVAIVLRLENLHLTLTHDEAYMYNAFASRSFWHMISDYHLPNNHVLLSIFIKIVTSLFGNHLWALRLPTIIIGAFMVPATYFFAKRFYGKETALLSSILVAIFPILVTYSVLARGYILMGLIAIMLFTLADYARVKKNRFVWLLIAVFSALGFFTLPIMLFPFGALYIWLFISCIFNDFSSYETKLVFLRYWVCSGISAAILTILLYLPILLNSFDRFFGNGFIAPMEWAIFPVTTWVRVRNTWLDWTITIPIGITLLGVLGFCISLVFHNKLSKQKIPVQLAFLAWIVVMLLLRRPNMSPRFWLFLPAFLLTWVAAGIIEPLLRIPLNKWNNWEPAKIVVGVVFLSVVLHSLWSFPVLPDRLKEKDGIEEITLYLKDNLQQGDLVTASVRWLPSLRYYFNYHGIPRGTIRQAGEFQRAFIVVDSENDDTLYFVSPKMGFDVPVIDMDSAKIVFQVESWTVYECYPAP